MPRIGVFVCHCGKNIAGVVDSEAVSKYAGLLPDVAHSVADIYTCSEAGQAELKKAIKEYNLNRIVVAACSPKMHEVTFRACVSDAGLNPYLMEMANIREHDSWVHMREPDKATEKAKDLVRMAVAKARLLEPLEPILVPVTKRALVIGGGIAGMRTALNVAEAGYEVVLVEKSPSLGGKTLLLDKTYPKIDCTWCQLQNTINNVLLNKNIRLLTLTEVVDIKGFVGNFKVTVKRSPSYVSADCIGCGKCIDACPVLVPDEINGPISNKKAIYLVKNPTLPMPCQGERIEPRKILHLTTLPKNPEVAVIDPQNCSRCGACVKTCPTNSIDLKEPSMEQELDVGSIALAIGFDLFDARRKPEYGYGRYPNVITSLELERMLNPMGPTQGALLMPSNRKVPKRLSFVQCVGCRDDRTNAYCGRICCMISLKQAILVKEKYPDSQVTMFYIDIRTGGKEYEAIYSKAQLLGVRFIRSRPSDIRERQGRMIVRSEDTLASAPMEEESDLVVLSTGIEAPRDASLIAEMLKVPRDPNGFFMEAHIKLKPVETVIDGVVLAGACSGPMDIPMSTARGDAASSKILSLFSKDMIELEPITSFIDFEKCKGCFACTKMCPFQAIKAAEKDEKKYAELLTSSCKGCGTCVAGCPFAALDQHHFTDEQMLAQIDAALEEEPSDKIISFNCNWCSYAGADFAGVSRLQYPANARIIRVMCSGRVSQKLIFRAFEKGAGMVLVAPCHPADCHYISGNAWAKKRVDQVKGLLPKKGVNPDRLEFVYVSAAEGNVYQKKIVDMSKFLQRMKEGEESWQAKEEIEQIGA